ncbi:NAD(P)-dependent glycerol-3-phosphate dehydrogenase [Candidatus Woesearchaeota archaeon]|nr:NAD(P)-dependent glycerol-3-phosphate dehydrogenase [Candidatus Woesearchaeota archaeon]
MNITILGGGSWGTALAVHLAKNNHPIKVWEFFESQAREMQEKRSCPLLPDVVIPGNVFISSKMEEVVPNSELLFIVVPSDKVESTLEAAKNLIRHQPLIICSKGLAGNLRLLSDAVKEKVGGTAYCLYGPTHAEEIGQGLFSGIVLAGGNKTERKKLQEVIQSDTLKVDLSDDIIGVQVCAALKNILAVFVGVCDGLNLGDNAKAYIITKGLDEIKQVGLKWGAKEETFHGLAGIGDVIVTCMSKHSRNRHVGEQVGKGRSLDDVLTEMKMIAEGVTTAKYIPLLKERFHLQLPLMTGLYDILFNSKKPQQVLHEW